MRFNEVKWAMTKKDSSTVYKKYEGKFMVGYLLILFENEMNIKKMYL